MQRFLFKLIFKLPDAILLKMSGSPQKTTVGGRKLDPASQLMLKGTTDQQVMKLDKSKSIAELREWWSSQVEQFKSPPLPGVRSSDRNIDVEGGSIRIREYVPSGCEENGPAVLYAHGGGFTAFDIDTHHSLAEFLCKNLEAKVYSVEYRLAPEHAFPIPLNDMDAAFQWVLDHAEELKIDPSRVSVMGESAGGNLAATLCLKRREEGKTLPKAQLLVVPGIDLTNSSESVKELSEGYFLTKEHIDWFHSNYEPDLEKRRNPLVSPIFAESLSRLPPAVVVTAGFDVLRDEGDAYAKKLKEDGVETHHIHHPSFLHGFMYTDLIDHITKAKLELCATFKKLI
ncbi:MAG: alpha/beta hydrolase [Myxococcota bacterium]|nr:alpha/beta hydrolase [Myxococcota bacterium]